MSARGKRRSFKTHSILTRGILAAGLGGVTLALPIVGATCAQAATPTAATTTDVQLITYKVVAGDTLAKIAQKYPTSGGAAKLYVANRAVIGPDPSTLRPGLTLTVGTKRVQIPTKATPAPTATKAPAKTYANNLDGWIKHSLDIMARAKIPGTYNGIHRNVMRESSGNPLAINNWDSNAKAGIPSKGLLQVIDPTFKAYHVPGTSMNPYDPVANITAACNYAAAKYGSIDNVNGPY
ncbi:transglycosylase SLT domain-containing protein [Streptomyces sp. RLB1-33]|uniref:transglycosylase SLT domain-containing protein n=1 Tax=Streptomyces mirabilis TaxID=68239 RepID=UPI00143E75B5|nr:MULTISPECIES: LysM peptidoglycan-binding domain-containing protein [Streptomyces]QIY72748.1 transglycosylase SLT domain-containing protein [Streptomyces sp. RLB1-33]QUW80292.1 LysM peptidoglycan-binding domain-containing protein [Streptomyces mirabilis]